jgi:hypothetical protein
MDQISGNSYTKRVSSFRSLNPMCQFGMALMCQGGGDLGQRHCQLRAKEAIQSRSHVAYRSVIDCSA